MEVLTVRNGSRWLTLAVLLTTGCSMVPRTELQRSQDYASDLRYQLDSANSELAQLARRESDARAQADQLAQQLASQQQIQSIMEQRVANLRTENDRLHEEMTGVVMRASGDRPTTSALMNVSDVNYVGFELPSDLIKKLDQFSKSHVGVTFDPVEKVVRFQSDTVFRDGGDRLRGDAQAALRELASILNSQKAGRLNLLVVGHTGGGVTPDTALLVQHPTDWHLAAHQAIAVEQYLEESGLSPTRAGIISYADQQPLVPPHDDVARQKNARVEIFILPPDPPADAPRSK